jgi:hypothetical protein
VAGSFESLIALGDERNLECGPLSAKIPVELWSELKREKLLELNAPTLN